MSNNWNERPDGHESVVGNRSRSGRLLHEYAQQGQQQSPYYYADESPVSPASPISPMPPVSPPLIQNQYSPVPSGPPVSQYSPMSPPPVQPQRNLFEEQQGQQRQWEQQGWQQNINQGWAANALQMARRWSGKMAAAHVARSYGQPEPPLVLRQPPLPTTPTPQPLTKPKRWKRSHAVRVSMRMRHRRSRWNDHSPKVSRIASGILIALLLIVVVLMSSTGAYAYSYYQSQLPTVQGLANQHIEQTSHIYDRNGVLLAKLYDTGPGGGRRTPVSYNNIPQVMRDAMVAAEDHTFWTNNGIDPQGISRAAYDYLTHGGSIQGGGSTITQQLVKNLRQDSAVSINRKISEAALAIGLTQQYPKWKILEMYFNVAPFGTLDLGVEAAAEEYFGLQQTCDANFKCTPAIAKLEYYNGKLNPIVGLARAALLAGMPQSPVSYDPTNGKQALQSALGRQNDVLNEMLGLGMTVDGQPITPTMITQAENWTAHQTFKREASNVRSPHFVEWVKQQLALILGNGDEQSGLVALYTGGFNVRTTIDANLEDYVTNAVTRHLDQPEYQPFLTTNVYGPLNTTHNVNNSAVVVMNSHTGEVLALDGSSDYNAVNNPAIDGQFDSATDAYRSPGSTWKPIVYATAFEMGWYPSMVLPDVKTYFPNGAGPDAANAWVPPDYGNQYVGGNNTIRVATADSRNVPAVKALAYAGIDNVANTARRMGITALDTDLANYNKTTGKHLTQVSQYNQLSFALGSMGVPLIQMADAYQTFANNGVHVASHSILDIWDNYGRHLYHYDTAHPQGTQVLSPQVSYLMTSVLTDEAARASEFGNDHVLSFYDWDPNRQVAAKTGTTDNFVDNWTMGYTPNVVVGVWSGNANNTPMNDIVGISGAAPIWHSVMERVSGMPCDQNSPNWDGVPCGNINLNALGITQQTTFTVPPGVHQASTSSTNGLRGAGNYDWLIDGEDPTAYGI